MEQAAPWIVGFLTTIVSGTVGWFARRPAQVIATEQAALDLYKDSLDVLDNVQKAFREMAVEREAMRAELMACVRAREDAAVERARDRVKIAQLEQGRAEDKQELGRLKSEVATLSVRTV